MQFLKYLIGIRPIEKLLNLFANIFVFLIIVKIICLKKTFIKLQVLCIFTYISNKIPTKLFFLLIKVTKAILSLPTL